MDAIEIDLRLKGDSVYATFLIEEPGVSLEFVEQLLCDLFGGVLNFDGKE